MKEIFSLFADVEDKNIRFNNQAQVMANMAQDNANKQTQKISPRGAAMILRYFDKIPKEDRALVQERFVDKMLKAGFVLQAA